MFNTPHTTHTPSQCLGSSVGQHCDQSPNTSPVSDEDMPPHNITDNTDTFVQCYKGKYSDSSNRPHQHTQVRMGVGNTTHIYM